MHGLTARLRAATAGEDGFTMIAVVLVIVVLMSITLATFTAVGGTNATPAGAATSTTSSSAGGDLNLQAQTRDGKMAYAAAEAGLSWYEAQLARNANYWTQCDGVPALQDGPAPVEQPTTTAAARKWRTIPGSTEQYVVDLVPANGNTTCNPADPQGSMIDTSTGTLRIAVTGRARAATSTGAPNYSMRTIVATFRRKGFLDFLWLTDLETTDPPLESIAAGKPNQSNPDITQWAAANCSKHWWDPTSPRSAARYNGQYYNGSSWVSWTNQSCEDIQFIGADKVQGPFHSNDTILVCGHPTFGGSSTDTVEVSAPSPGYRQACAGASPTVTGGTLQTGADTMDMPPDNAQLESQTTPGYHFVGKTTIVFNSTGTMTVTNPTMGLAGKTMQQPANGVIYVANGTCGANYNPTDPMSDPQGCGDAIVQGTYTQSMTIGAAQDVLVTEDLLSSGDVLLGLIANNYVRVYHPMASPPAQFSGGSCTSSNAQGSGTSNPLYNMTIDAAILTLNHSFLVDNWECGAQMGTLTVHGVIAQKYRGPVGTSGSTGYVKDYSYDTRLRYRSPPAFLDPVQSSWRLMRVVQQSAASQGA